MIRYSKSPCTKCTLHKCQTYSSDVWGTSAKHITYIYINTLGIFGYLWASIIHFTIKQTVDGTHDTRDLQISRPVPTAQMDHNGMSFPKKLRMAERKPHMTWTKGFPFQYGWGAPSQQPSLRASQPEQKASSKHISPSSYCHPLVQQSGLASNALTCTPCICERWLNRQQLDSQKQDEPTRPHRTPHTRPAVCKSAIQLQVCNQVH